MKNMLSAAHRDSSSPHAAAVPHLGKPDLFFENTGVLKNKKHRTLNEGDDYDPTLDAGVLHAASVPGVLKNKKHRTLGEGDECDPTLDADMLQCGSDDLICYDVDDPISTSSLSGVCMTLEDVIYELCYSDPDYCGCEDLDKASGSGTQTCKHCIAPVSVNLEASVTYATEYTAFEATSYSICSEITKPSKLFICYNVNFEASTCEISIGTTISGMTTCDSCVYDTTGSGTTFDCRNVATGQAGNLDNNDFPLSILEGIFTRLNDDNFDAKCGAAGPTKAPGKDVSATKAPTKDVAVGRLSIMAPLLISLGLYFSFY
jgi:hypothetical protein